mmetsp:Transcript_13074/g.39591  ORF Transcript_13074/g.39591 Transcript_13074/m.39591 type:complete len:230 (-) Transcript_13074:158-847(-)
MPQTAHPLHCVPRTPRVHATAPLVHVPDGVEQGFREFALRQLVSLLDAPLLESLLVAINVPLQALDEQRHQLLHPLRLEVSHQSCHLSGGGGFHGGHGSDRKLPHVVLKCVSAKHHTEHGPRIHSICRLLHARLAFLVVLLTLTDIAENLVGLPQRLKLRSCLWVVRVFVWVDLPGLHVVCLLYLGRGCISRYSQHVVILRFLHHDDLEMNISVPAGKGLVTDFSDLQG